MGNIYKHCVFMISAEFCHDHTESIFTHAAAKNYAYQGCHSSAACFSSRIATYHTTDEEARVLARGVLRTRAWALQEEVLSPRTLKWTQEQLVWECLSTTITKEFPSIEKAQDNFTEEFMGYDSFKMICLPENTFQQRPQMTKNAIDTGNRDPRVLWYRIVTDFCRRHISYSADTLPAISDIAREIARHTGFHYRARLWAEDFHNGLLWSTNGSEVNVKVEAGPTWRWASRCSGSFSTPAALIVTFSLKQHVVTPLADILSLEINYTEQDEYSLAKSGRLRMSGLCKRMAASRKDSIILQSNEDDTKSFLESTCIPWQRSSSTHSGLTTSLQ